MALPASPVGEPNTYTAWVTHGRRGQSLLQTASREQLKPGGTYPPLSTTYARDKQRSSMTQWRRPCQATHSTNPISIILSLQCDCNQRESLWIRMLPRSRKVQLDSFCLGAPSQGQTLHSRQDLDVHWGILSLLHIFCPSLTIIVDYLHLWSVWLPLHLCRNAGKWKRIGRVELRGGLSAPTFCFATSTVEFVGGLTVSHLYATLLSTSII